MDTQNSQSNSLVKAGVIVGVSLFFGLLFDYFFYGKIPGIAFPLYIILNRTPKFRHSFYEFQELI